MAPATQCWTYACAVCLVAALGCGDSDDSNGGAGSGAAGGGGMAGTSAGTSGGAASATATIAASTMIVNPAPDVAGTGTLTEAAGQVTLTLDVTGCPEGDHGFHIHAGTACGTDGSEAMTHWDPLMVDMHGQVGEGAPHHAGDVGMVACDADGNGTLTITTDEWSLTDGADDNPIGHAVILHGLDPAQRIGCGVIEAGAGGASFTVAATTLSVNPAADLAGTATFTEAAGGDVTVVVSLTGCPEGDHGFHIHAGTSCGADGSEAMTHWDPLMAGVHAQVGEAAPHHAGDVGMVACDASGNGTLMLTTNEWTLSDAAADNNPIGQAVVVHGLDPAHRVGCGVIQ